MLFYKKLTCFPLEKIYSFHNMVFNFFFHSLCSWYNTCEIVHLTLMLFISSFLQTFIKKGTAKSGYFDKTLISLRSAFNRRHLGSI